MNNKTGFELIQDLFQLGAHPTGSRCFGNATQFSDWDLFMAQTEATEKSLKNLGFSKMFGPRYNDTLTASVWSITSKDGMNIHIQLVTNVGLKLKAQNAIKDALNLGFLLPPKAQRKKLWNEVIRTIKKGH